MAKRGQVTIFFVLGLLIAFGAIFIIYAKGENTSSEMDKGTSKLIKVRLDLRVIKDKIEDTLFYVSKAALRKAGWHGGYVSCAPDPVYNVTGIPGQHKLYYRGRCVPLYYNGSHMLYPRIREIENNLEKLILVEFDRYLNLTEFANLSGFSIRMPALNLSEGGNSSGNANITVMAGYNNVLIKLRYPIELVRDDTITVLKDFAAQVPVRLGKAYNLSVNLTEEIAQSADYDISSKSCIDFDPEMNQTIVYGRLPDSRTVIVRISDFGSSSYDSTYGYNTSYSYQFAVRKDDLDFFGFCCKE